MNNKTNHISIYGVQIGFQWYILNKEKRMVILECLNFTYKVRKINTHTEVKDLYSVAQMLSIQSGQQLKITHFVNVQTKQSEKLNNTNSMYRSFKSNLIKKN